ncbi:MAG: gliding motility-associated C-terminal domain-containing protein [Flavobacteriales bacterium]|nr:gliding motility-associated C-terminal domain-containing protein [Flavobacteriales bacterium]
MTLALSGQADQNWFFGWHAGIDFNGAQPLATNGAMNVAMGSATISDASGELLFYSDGIKVWNRSHEVMPNGAGLLGEEYVTQAALIVGQPGHCGIFYLFTSANAPSTDALRYSVIDMSLDNGLGDVVAGMKNVLLANPMGEKLTALRHGNGVAAWVFSRALLGDAFYAYLLTEQGLDTIPVISHVGQNTFLGCDAGFLKVSHDGTELFHLGPGCQIAEIFDVDAAVGMLSGAQDLFMQYDLPNVLISMEFSPNGQFLYFTQYIPFDSTSVIQIDRATGIRTILDADFDYQGHGDLRLGPDGRIYVAHQIEGFVDVIEYPDLPGAACGFTPAGFALQVPLVSYQGLPNNVLPYTMLTLDLGNDTTFSCATEPFHLFVPTTINGSFSWQDGSTGPTFLVDTSGTYSVEVISLCGSAIDTLLVLSGDDEVDVDPWSGILPNVFTPNNDGENETFPLLPVPMEKMSITINDRWGAPVFRSDDRSPLWNGEEGTTPPSPCPDGVYFYTGSVQYSNTCRMYDRPIQGSCNFCGKLLAPPSCFE